MKNSQTIATLLFLDSNENELTRINVSFEYTDDNDWKIKSEEIRKKAEAKCMINDCTSVVIL